MTIAVEIRHLQVDGAALARLRCAVRACLPRAGRAPAEAEAAIEPAQVFEAAAAWLPAPWSAPPVEVLADPCMSCGDAMPERLDLDRRCPECVEGTRLITALAAVDGGGRRRRPDPEPAGMHRRSGELAANPDEYRPIRERSGGGGLWTYIDPTDPEASR